MFEFENVIWLCDVLNLPYGVNKYLQLFIGKQTEHSSHNITSDCSLKVKGVKVHKLHAPNFGQPSKVNWFIDDDVWWSVPQPYADLICHAIKESSDELIQILFNVLYVEHLGYGDFRW